MRSGKADAVNNCQFRGRESAGEMVTKFTASLTTEIRISFLARLLFGARAFCAREVFVVAFHANIDGPRPCADTPLDEILRVGYYWVLLSDCRKWSKPTHTMLAIAFHKKSRKRKKRQPELQATKVTFVSRKCKDKVRGPGCPWLPWTTAYVKRVYRCLATTSEHILSWQSNATAEKSPLSWKLSITYLVRVRAVGLHFGGLGARKSLSLRSFEPCCNHWQWHWYKLDLTASNRSILGIRAALLSCSTIVCQCVYT